MGNIRIAGLVVSVTLLSAVLTSCDDGSKAAAEQAAGQVSSAIASLDVSHAPILGTDVSAAQSQLKDEAGMADTLEEEAADYNDPADWGEIIAITFGTPGLRDQDQIWLGRLLFVVGTQVPSADASTVGQIASQHGFFGDAMSAKAHGGQVDPDPSPRADSDKKTMPDQIAQQQAQDGAFNAKLAEALYGYGMYRESEAAAKLAIQKGGNPDPSEAPMVLGQALTAQGKYDEAVGAFSQVKVGGPGTPRIARLWTAYAKIKKRG